MKTEEERRAEKLFKKISKKAGKTIREHNLIQEGDRLLLGLSGGKDSMILMEILADRIKSFPFDFSVFVAHIVPVGIGYHVNMDELKRSCEAHGFELISREIQPDLSRKDKSECFLCSWFRRKALFDLSRELSCNLLAFGHHRDDALETFLINLIHHGSISSMPYSLNMFDGRLKLIRPLMDIWEAELDELAGYRNCRAIEKSCPHENLTSRKRSRELIQRLSDENPNARVNMFHALSNIYPEYLPELIRKQRK